ncbi:MAG: Alginate biosynthesis protein AlgA [Lentisphaerae bacterium ADurb.Bin242]|nr:MAG: Alginate biosynthesis protein AlgA [Lentisphaerae bacterium ADurb.Bin242]
MAAEYCVIMAGGKGERFWPCSREETPKQLLNIFGDTTLIEQTVLRLVPMIPFENILIVTNRKYADKMRALLPQLPPDNIIGEPCGRDTAPCVALAAGVIKARAGTEDAVMLLLPSDHCIHDAANFQKDLKSCCELARKSSSLITIGIPPTFPSSDYGYIECGEKIGERTCRVRKFVEKPSAGRAAEMLASGNYKWNSGMFVWKVGTVLDILRRHAPDLADLSSALEKAWLDGTFRDVLSAEYETCRKISIDYAVMEKADNIVVLEASFDWDDIGNWTALSHHFQPDKAGNVVVGKFESLNSHDCIIFSGAPDHLLCAIDMNDAVIVHTPDVTLFCPKNSTPKIKEFLAMLAGKPEMKIHF